jgi:cytochrome c553
MRFQGFFVLTTCLAGLAICSAQQQRTSAAVIPTTWDDEAIATIEIPLANPVGSPKHVSADYYYRIPVRGVYKGYPVYAPGHEPPGYMDWLKQLEPIVIWDDRGHAPPLRTETDWIRAGQIVFDAATRPPGFENYGIDDVRNRDFYATIGAPVAKDGTVPAYQYMVRTKGTVELGVNACAACHSRVMPDGSVLKGAQSNFPVQRSVAYGLRANAGTSTDKEQRLAQQRRFLKSLHAAPWLHPDPEERVDTVSYDEMASVFEAIPPGVHLRQRSNTFTPIQVSDLIGVKDRRYLDHTGLDLHRSIVDLMRYAAMNTGADSLASYAGFIPADRARFQQLPPPESVGRYSDEQLYALAKYIYSLEPPANPNPFDAVAERGQQVFNREGCAACHTPPLYTNNKLTPADGFAVPPDHRSKYDILPISVGTDPDLTLKTRRGTGYYKVPSLKGVWYRSMFGHSGWCATLDDWFDPRRLRDDYVPTGWKPHDRRTYAVEGHPFGLVLSSDDRRALIAFLNTL